MHRSSGPLMCRAADGAPTTQAAVAHLLEALLRTAPPASVQAIVEGSGWPAAQP